MVGRIGERPELTSRYTVSPLKIAKTFPLDSGGVKQLAVVQMDVSPGMLDGDRYTFDWRLEAGVRLYATNQAYTRVHPCERSDARLRQTFRLEAGAVLEWMPEPVMLYRSARFRSETEIELAEDAVCLLSDIICPGRLLHGEKFAFTEYDARLTVRLNGETIHYQRQKWEPAALPIANAGCFGPHTHVGGFYAFSDRVTAQMVDRLREAMEAGGGVPDGVVWGVSRTARHGLTVQAAGNAAWKLQRTLLEAWDAARRLLLDQPPLRLLKEAWMRG